ncbi:MAG: sodium:solute symporter family protein [Saprospiraceae bacterium]|nr:sodium:solute symporter family protein [Saprospiraceae bacterium]
MHTTPTEHLTLIIFIAIYLLATLLIGWWAAQKVKTTQDFVIAGRRLPMFIAACALFATWFGSETVMGASSEFIADEEGAPIGLLRVIEDPFGAALCLVLVGAFFAKPLYKLNILTFSDFFKLRYSRTTELFSALFMVPSFFGWVAAQLVAMAIILQVLGGIDLHIGIAVCTIIVVIYTYIGGMWAVSVTDFVQTIMIIAGLLLLAFQLGNQAGGVSEVLSQQPEGFFNMIPEFKPIPFLEYIAAWITIGLGSIPGQDVFQRVMSAKSARTSVISSYVAGAMYLSIGLIPLFIALCGKALYPDLRELGGVENEQLMLPVMVLKHGTLLIQIMFFGALLSAILSTASGAILAPATIIGENLVRPYLRNTTDKRLLQVMRFSVVAVAGCSALMASVNTNIYELVGQSSSLSLVSLFIPLTMGIYWKKASNAGALSAIIAGMSAWLLCEWQGTEVPSIIIGGLVSLVAMIAGSYIRPDQSYQAFKLEAGQSGNDE